MRKGGITNRSLIILLVIAMIISLIGTFISLSLVSKIGSPYLTGRAWIGTGNVSVKVAGLLSIMMIDDKVEYGTCKPPSEPGKYYPSDGDNMYSAVGEEGKCTGSDLKPHGDGDYLVVANDGNLAANVTVMTNETMLILGTVDTSFWFKTEPSSENPGCYMIFDWTNFSQANIEYPACGNLTHLIFPTRNAFRTAFRIWVPHAAGTGEATAVITYTAHLAT